ncbi:MAG TPA: phosphoenolpyruvate--protein phosphotransferase [Bacteroidota bacterium]|nr:phosphoenolpyruvate--protein phosphotransferase [Bacteroidota bacterium]
MDSSDTANAPEVEIVLKGIAAAPGISTGPAYLYSKAVPRVQEKSIRPEEVESEIVRLRSANARAEKELQKIHAFAEQKLGSQNARIFEAQIMILGDGILMGTIEKRIASEMKNAEFIVADEISKYKQLMLAAHDEYMHERALDVDDVMNRIIRNIQDQKLFSRLEGESIIISETLAPADTVIFSRNQILGYATDLGGVTSHAAILARSLKIPAVLGLRNATKAVRTGDALAIDGYAGVVIVHPTEETLQTLTRKKQRFREFEERLVDIAGLTAETLDHKHIELSANIEYAEEIQFARVQGAAGIGLFRTESQLLGKPSYPTEEEQYQAYQTISGAVYPHSVIFRTFDVGGDKLSPDTAHEANPFLGWRGIRVLLDRPELFLDQLRGILRASTRKNVRIMFPMISTVQEIRQAKAFVAQAKKELDGRGLTYDPHIKIGVMIEVPAAAVLAEEIASEVDFLSIGTNDLIQYLMAVDRDNAAVAPLYQQFHPAVLRTIKHVIDAGHKRGVWVGMCGEMAGDPLATVLLVGLGIDELSVLPSVLPEIKKIILSIRQKDAKRVADRLLARATEQEIKDELSALIRNKVPEIPLDL